MTSKQRFRNNKYRLELRERDHGPAHVHLTGGGFDVIIYLATFEWPRGLREEVLAWVSVHHNELMKEWQKWHP
jgi:hypothetical protein